MAQLRVVGELDDRLDQLLAAVVGGVRLAGDDRSASGARGAAGAAEPLGVAEHQRRRLYGGEAAREADRQRRRGRARLGPAELGLRGAALQARLAQPAAGAVDEPLRAARAWSTTARSSGIRSTTFQTSARVGVCSEQDAEVAARSSSTTSRATQVGVWTPLVIEVIGTSASRRPARGRCTSRDDLAVQLGDAVGAWASRKPITVMLNDAAVAALVVLGAEARGSGRSARRRPGSAGRSTARSGRAGSGRCPRAPGCAW